MLWGISRFLSIKTSKFVSCELLWLLLKGISAQLPKRTFTTNISRSCFFKCSYSNFVYLKKVNQGKTSKMIITKMYKKKKKTHTIWKRGIKLNRKKIISNYINQILPIVFGKLSLEYDNTQFKLSKCKRMYTFLWNVIKVLVMYMFSDLLWCLSSETYLNDLS